MTTASISRLAWEISAARPNPAFFGVHVVPGSDVQALVRPTLANMASSPGISFLDASHSLEYLDDVLDDRKPSVESEIVFLEDTLGRTTSNRRKRLNYARELLRRLGKILVFVESRPGSPEAFDDLRDLLATFRDVVDLRPSVLEEDHLWDTASAFGLERVAGTLPKVVTRGSILVKDGIVHRKTPLAYHCPACGRELSRATTVVRFIHAVAERAEQAVPGFACECGEVWPDPKAMRDAHRSAFDL